MIQLIQCCAIDQYLDRFCIEGQTVLHRIGEDQLILLVSDDALRQLGCYSERYCISDVIVRAVLRSACFTGCIVYILRLLFQIRYVVAVRQCRNSNLTFFRILLRFRSDDTACQGILFRQVFLNPLVCDLFICCNSFLVFSGYNCLILRKACDVSGPVVVLVQGNGDLRSVLIQNRCLDLIAFSIGLNCYKCYGQFHRTFMLFIIIVVPFLDHFNINNRFVDNVSAQ